MKYDDGLARKILLFVELLPPRNDGKITIEGHTQEEISYHIKKLHEKGLVKGINAETFGKMEWLATDITSKGHEFLKTIRGNEIVKLPENVFMEKQTDSKIVFVVHGRNSKARKSLFQFLRSIGLHPLEWSEAVEKTGKASPYVGEVLEKAFSIAQAAIILFTPDDEARLREEHRGSKEPVYETELTGQARPNVIFEAGMAMGMFPDRTVLVELGELRPISDIGGRHVIRMNNNVSRRQELAQRLKTAGCIVNLSGTDWHDEGDFSTELFNPKKKAVAKTTAFESNTEENAEKVLIRVKNTIYALENFHSNPEGIYYIGQTILECESFLEELGQLEPVEGVISEIINEIDNDTRKDEGLFDPIISISKVRKIIKHLKQIRLDLLNGNVET